MPVIVTPHTVNNLDFNLEQSFENEGYESDEIKRQQGNEYSYEYFCCVKLRVISQLIYLFKIIS